MVEEYFDRLGRLPCEILHNIALLLPFNSIIHLRWSSKFWYNLLTDPKFVDLHLTHALEKPPGYLFSAPLKLRYKKACYFVEELEGDLNTSKIFEYHERWRTFQSSGGLMCAYLSESCCFRIFNPYIGEQVQVPRDHKFKGWRFFNYSFSYSPSIKEYKILIIGKVYSGTFMGQICTLGSNIWRDVQIVPRNKWDFYGHTQCQGNVYWMEETDLHFFDFVSEKFHVIPGPPVHDLVQVTHYSDTYVQHMRKSLISMGHTVGYVHNDTLWVLEDKAKGIWMKRYDFPIPPLVEYYSPMVIGTSENGHLFGHIDYYTNTFFILDMGCGYKVWEMNLNEHRDEEYIAPHVRSFVSPVRIMKMGSKLNYKEKSVLDTLELDYDATKDDLINRMYEFLQAYEKNNKSGDL